MKESSLLLFLLFVCASAQSQTTINTSIYNNTTWPLSGSPYNVTIDLVVFTGVTLTIDPGVVVEFADGKEFDLRGKLVAIGTVNDSITFTSASSAPYAGIWGGIRINAVNLVVNNQVTMKYCKGLYADRLLDMDLAYEGPYIFEHCLFSNNTRVSYDGGWPTVRFSECTFSSNHTALDYCQFGGKVRQSYFLNNVYGVDGFSNVDTCYFSGNTGVALSAYGAAVGNTVENNSIGVRCYFNAVNDTFLYNTVRNNVIGVEIQTYFNGSILFQQNWICNNSLYNIKLTTANNADLSNNCWCTEGGQPVQSTIYDGYDDPNYGLVTFLPVAINCPSIMTDVNDNTAENNPISVYPNPSSGVFQLNCALENAMYVIYNIAGEEIANGTFLSSGTVSVDLSTEATGIYFVRVVADEKVYTQKLLKD